MLKPESDRISYAAELAPPDGYRLKCAVATTYSLDLETLVAASIPLGISQELDGDELKCPVGLLHAIRKISDKVVVFCEAGQVKCPERDNRLMPLLDAMVVPVALGKKGRGDYPAFHPKTWALQFENVDDENDCFVRYIVLSRNLTFDRSWDVAVSLEGKFENRTHKPSLPLVEFMKFLGRQIRGEGGTSARKRRLVNGFVKDLPYVKFELDRREFGEFEFIPSGIGDRGQGFGACDLFCSEKGTRECSFHDLAVVSPFLSPKVVRLLNDPMHDIAGTRRVLITRQEALNTLKPEDVRNFETYLLKPEVVFGEMSLSDDETTSSRNQDIHAKIYLRRKWSEADLYIGSANATLHGTGIDDGVVQNVEMMLRLRGKNGHVNLSSLLSDLFCGDVDDRRCPFERGEVQEMAETPDETVKRSVERAIKVFCRCVREGIVQEDNGLYSISLSFNVPETEVELSLSPLCAPGLVQPVAGQMRFAAMRAESLSEFFVVTGRSGDVVLKRVLQIPLSGMPAQRDAAVLNSVIESKEALCRYLALVFSDNPSYALRNHERRMKSLGGEDRTFAYMMSGVYEEMLKASVKDPHRIRDAGWVLEHLASDVEGFSSFRRLYETFASVLKIPVEVSVRE